MPKGHPGTAVYVKRTCMNCGEEFDIKQTAVENGRGKFCSRRCKLEYQTGSHRKKYSSKCKHIGHPIYRETW